MNKKIIVLLIVVAIAILGLLLYLDSDYSSSGEKTTLNVSSEGPIGLKALIKDIKTNDFYTGYDNETVKWMESLGNKYVFVSGDYYVIMNKLDADKIPSIFATDVDFTEIFECNVLEMHSLGSGDNFRDVLLVDHVKYKGENAHYYDV